MTDTLAPTPACQACHNRPAALEVCRWGRMPAKWCTGCGPHQIVSLAAQGHTLSVEWIYPPYDGT